jgi:Glyoxalase-like domain
VRSKGTLYLALHQDGTYAWGRWVGMSYDGPIVTGWGAIARTEDQAHHRSRVCQFVIDVDDLDRGVAFWSAALDATEEQLSERSRPIYRLLRLPDAEIRVLLQRTDDEKVAKNGCISIWRPTTWRLRSDALEALGATRYDHQQERGFDLWVLRDPSIACP